MRITHQKSNILGVHFDLVRYRDVCDTIEAWRASREQHYVCVSNADTVMMAYRDDTVRYATNGASLVLPDGIGIVAAARLCGYSHQGRVTGPTLMLKLCDWGRARRFRHYFLGGAPGIPEKLAERLSSAFPGLEIAGIHSPPFRELSDDEDRGLVARVNAAKPDIVWIGLGAPKQEKWMEAHLGRIDAPAMIGVGAAFDFHSGNARWAPAWVRKCGMEWAYRFAHSPRRLWRRTLDKLVFPFFLCGERCRVVLRTLGRS